MRARIELLEATCRNPEDNVEADLLYLAGALFDGVHTHPISLSPMGMRRGQTRSTWPDQSVIVDGEVASDAVLDFGVHAYEKDFQRHWGAYRDWCLRLAETISAEIAKERPDDRPGELINRRRLAAILRGAGKVVDTLANLDKDDHLGEHAVTIPLDGIPITTREARFAGTNGLGSSWDYVLRYRIALPQRAIQDHTVRYGQTIKVMHLATTKVLHSHPLAYRHHGGSGQQQVTAFAWLDDNDWWRVKAADGHPDDFRHAEPVQHGDVVRLEHIATRRNLHSHAGLRSPVTHQQEVTCFGTEGGGDGNDNWTVEIPAGGTWDGGKPLRLIHTATGHALHSHHGHADPSNTANQQEVTGFAARDDNDLWMLLEA